MTLVTLLQAQFDSTIDPAAYNLKHELVITRALRSSDYH